MALIEVNPETCLREGYASARESVLFQFEKLWQEAHPGCKAFVENAGGGKITLYIDRDALYYPPVGAEVHLTWEAER